MEQIHCKDFTATLKRILAGEIEAPNREVITDPKEALNLLAGMDGEVMSAYQVKFPLGEFDFWHVRVFTKTGGMYQSFTGDGAILTSAGRVVKFAMCEHEWDTSGANHQRGWHPCRCRKCNMDISVDSGD